MHAFLRSQFKTVGFVLVCLLLFAAAGMAAERLAVGVSVANVRSGPGQNYDVLWQAEKNTPIAVLDRDESGDWCYFKDYEGTKAWIHKNLLRDLDTVITKTGLCNIRSGPGTSHDLVFQAEAGVPFRVLSRKGNWLQIRHADGDKGWIHKKLVW